jgi:hypothetical protein
VHRRTNKAKNYAKQHEVTYLVLIVGFLVAAIGMGLIFQGVIEAIEPCRALVH